MEALDPFELACLRRQAEGAHALAPCPAHVIDRLMHLGLIEQLSPVRYPLTSIRVIDQLTLAGRAVLAAPGNRK